MLLLHLLVLFALVGNYYHFYYYYSTTTTMMILAFFLENQGLPRPLIALSYLTYYRSISNTIEEYPTFLAADCRLDEIELVNTVHKKPTTHKKSIVVEFTAHQLVEQPMRVSCMCCNRSPLLLL